jgi:hypothetical protein
MRENDETKKEKAPILKEVRPSDLGVMDFIPQCCKEGWASCKHVAKEVRTKKRNVGV